MIYPSIDKLLNQVGSKYLLVNIVSKKDIGKALEEISKDMIHLKDN